MLYKVNFKIGENAHLALVNLTTKCGNCSLLESNGFKKLCVNNCRFDPLPTIKRLIHEKYGLTATVSTITEIQILDNRQSVIALS